jgi:hypothetical protein
MHDALMQALLPMAFASDHLLALADLLRGPGGLYAVYTVARGCLEADLKTWYLMAPGIGPDERVRRRLNERLHGLHDSLLLTEALGKDGRAQRSRMERILSEARARGYPVTVASGYRAPFIKEPNPSYTVMLREMTGGQEVGGYRILSTVAHPTSPGLASMLDWSIQRMEPDRGEGWIAFGGVRQNSAVTVGGACGY